MSTTAVQGLGGVWPGDLTLWLAHGQGVQAKLRGHPVPATSQTVSLCAAAPVRHAAVLGLVACAPAKSRAPFPHYRPASSIQPCTALEGQALVCWYELHARLSSTLPCCV
jgi:hypothetical protein